MSGFKEKIDKFLKKVNNDETHQKFIIKNNENKIIFYNKQKGCFFEFVGKEVYQDLPTNTDRAIRSKIKKICFETQNKLFFNFHVKDNKLFYMEEIKLTKIKDLESLE